MLDKIGDLPAHPLIVHLPIVLGPLLGLLAVACLVPSWRERLLVPVAALAVIFAVACVLAVESGESLRATLGLAGTIDEHAEAAETLRLLSFALAVVAVGAAALRRRLSGGLELGAMVLLALIGLATIGFTVKTGHEGATAVWSSRVP